MDSQILMHLDQVFCYIKLHKNLSPLRAWSFMTPEALFEQTLISLTQGYSMPNINVFPTSGHEKKIFEDLSKYFLFCPLLDPKRGQPLYLNKSESPYPKHVSCKVWLKLAQWFLRIRLLSFSLYILLCTSLSPWGGPMHNPRDYLNKLESPCPKDAPC